MNRLAIIISDPLAESIEQQILESLKISISIIISFCDFNLIDVITSIIERYKLDDFVNMVQYDKTPEIEFNPLIENPNPIDAFWNNISRINGVNMIISESFEVDWILFLKSNELPNENFSAYFDNINSTKCSYIFNEIILMPVSIFCNDLNIVKILMNENERIGSAKSIEFIQYTETEVPLFDIIS